jgi:hypothetical protein
MNGLLVETISEWRGNVYVLGQALLVHDEPQYHSPLVFSQARGVIE